MKRFFVILAICSCCVTLSAQTFKEWQDPKVNEVNRATMHTNYFAFSTSEKTAVPEESVNYLTLHGNWKFLWVKNSDQRPSGFWASTYDDSSWDSIQVPGMWELNGYGSPIYVNTGYAWRNQFQNNPPEVPVAENHVGSYRREIEIPASWSGKDVIMHIGSATSCIYVWVNGKFVGYSEDSKLEAEFDITKYIVPGKKNTVAMQIFRWCDGTYLEDQDFFRYSGIARESYLYARSKARVEDVRITPDLDENYKNGSLDVELTFKGNANSATVDLVDPNGKGVASLTIKSPSKGGVAKATFNVEAPAKWTAETPDLYTVRITSSGEIIEVTAGFRKIELKNSQILVNGQPILIKGVDRHEMDPDGGYVMSKDRMIQDIKIMKQFNVNAVRTCHYPDDNFWYDLCDKYGIYMVAEANLESHGMGYGDRTLAKNADYALAHMQRNQRNVQRNYNHPAIIFWSLGNEAGYGENFEAAYDWIKAEDHSRAVQYEQARINGKTDIYCPMYAGYEQSERYAQNPDTNKPLIQCEYAHAMGNSEGGFAEYWELFRKYDKLQGGFIWDFVDQSIRWTGKNGKMIYAYGGDFNRYDGSDTNFCDNGLISPDRIPNPHMYEVGYYYQNIWTRLEDSIAGNISIYNENFFKNLSDCRLVWDVLSNGIAVKSGVVENLDVPAHGNTTVSIPIGKLNPDIENLLNVRYELKEKEGLLDANYVIARQQLPLTEYKQGDILVSNHGFGGYSPSEPSIISNDARYIIVEGEDFLFEVSKRTGFISRYKVGGIDMILEGEEVVPNFWRAPTDNDFGANLQFKFRSWNNPDMILNRNNGISTEVKDGIVVITSNITIRDVADMTLTYEINNVGEVKVTEMMRADPSKKISDMFRYGMKLVMPESFNRVEYYGRGPGENYADRKDNTFIGIYSQSVDEQFYPYIRPQENGTRSDLRWWRVYDAAGNGIQFTSDHPFSASALHYSIESLDEGLTKANGHSNEIEPQHLTTVCIDKAQMGLGCVNSWGALPLDKYMLHYGDYEFVYLMTPLRNHIR